MPSRTQSHLHSQEVIWIVSCISVQTESVAHGVHGLRLVFRILNPVVRKAQLSGYSGSLALSAWLSWPTRYILRTTQYYLPWGVER